MYFSKLLLKDFGKFHNRDINLKPGVNVVYGTRNAGKSTVADFEYATLYGIGTFPETEDDDLAHHKPMDGHGFSGKAYVIKDGDEYLVERSFRKHNMTTQVLNVKNGRVGKLKHKNSLYESLTGVDKRHIVMHSIFVSKKIQKMKQKNSIHLLPIWQPPVLPIWIKDGRWQSCATRKMHWM